jgi:serine/threonine protein kinase
MPDKVVLKVMRTTHCEFDRNTFESSRLEALILERLSSSPRIVDIHGACSTSVSVEFMPLEVEDNIIRGSGYSSAEEIAKCEAKQGASEGQGQAGEDTTAKSCDEGSQFSATQKLEMALGMAEALADVHGYSGGVIVHDDIQPCQFLRNERGEMKLNDFNRGEVMLFDDGSGGRLNEHGETGEYCRYNNGGVYGNARSPEEDAEHDLNEQIDVYSLGNIYYELLTGLWNFYEYEDDAVVQKKVMAGEMPFIDPRYSERSYAEKSLVHAIERALVKEPDDRASVFELVDFLQHAVSENKKQKLVQRQAEDEDDTDQDDADADADQDDADADQDE